MHQPSDNIELKETKIPHSVPVPRVYKDAAVILKKYCEKQGSLKRLLYERKSRHHLKKLMAILSKTISHYSSIEKALSQVRLFEEHPQFQKHLAFILTSELMQHESALVGNCKPILVINTYAKKLNELLNSAQPEHVRTELPKYARINLLLCSEDEVHKELKNLGFVFKDYNRSETTYEEFLNYVKDLCKYSYIQDYHIPHLFVFHPREEFYRMPLYQRHALVLQDKASCLPVFCSGVKPGDVVVDCCAAPGNKASHLAAQMGNQGRLFALDRDEKRFKILNEFLHQRGVTCANTYNEDFRSLDLDSAQVQDIKLALVDPSCSSSGTSLHHDEVSSQRISRLSSIQFAILTHALSLPSVQTVIYSTCSIYEEENEEVVKKALSMFHSTFHLEDLRKDFPNWKHFGSKKYECGPFCLKTNTDLDLCQGFFVAKFVRNEDAIKTAQLRE